MSKEQDRVFFRNFSLVVGAIAVMMVVFFTAAQFVGTDDEAEAKLRASKVAEVTAPVGQVTAVGEEMPSEAKAPETAEVAAEKTTGETGGNTGETVFKGLCVNCHGVAALATMVPQAGDKAAWGPRIEQGIDTLHSHALNGFTGNMGMMPAKGGNPALTDEEVKAAVDYIVSLAK